MSTRWTALLALPLLCLLLLGADCNDEMTEIDDVGRLHAMEQSILNYARQPDCGGEGDCRFIGMGVNPCGGPYYYLIYSTSAVDSVELVGMVEEYNEFNDELNARYGWAGPCVVPNPPVLDCAEGTCVDVGYDQ